MREKKLKTNETRVLKIKNILCIFYVNYFFSIEISDNVHVVQNP